MNGNNKWSGAYLGDLAERVGSTLIYGVITLLTTIQLTDINKETGWAIVGLPTVLSLLKGILANMASPESGASLIKAPPGPVIEDAQGRDEFGTVNWLACIFVALLGVVVILLFGLYDVIDTGINEGRK